jgi:hypothetical protein
MHPSYIHIMDFVAHIRANQLLHAVASFFEDALAIDDPD